jgi:hypothetical protein
MPTIYTEVEVDVSLDDFQTDDLIDEIERRGRGLEVSDSNGSELVEKIFNLRRLGKDFDRELNELIYVVTGRII